MVTPCLHPSPHVNSSKQIRMQVEFRPQQYPPESTIMNHINLSYWIGKLTNYTRVIISKKRWGGPSHLNGGHGHWDVKVPPIIDGFHHGYAMGTLNILSWILASGYKDGRNNVTSMSIKPTKSTSDSRTSKVFEHVKLHQGRHVGLQYLLHHFFFDDCFTNNWFPTSLDPIHCSRFLVRTIIS